VKVAWFSAGVSSFVAALLSRPDRIIYIDIDDQHPDSLRFVQDCEKTLDQKIEPLKSPYGSVENAVRAFGFIASAYGAKCTDVLKKRVRKEWERQQSGVITHVWGFDITERDRAENICAAMPKGEHEFPLIDAMLTKADAHGICAINGVKRPAMYDLGYSNNNCVGCVKGGMGYWNKIRVDFPEVFRSRAKLERDIGHSCINGVFLDELDPNAGRMSEEVLPECGIFCELALQSDGGQGDE
jgi:hypothetical protein